MFKYFIFSFIYIYFQTPQANIYYNYIYYIFLSHILIYIETFIWGQSQLFLFFFFVHIQFFDPDFMHPSNLIKMNECGHNDVTNAMNWNLPKRLCNSAIVRSWIIASRVDSFKCLNMSCFFFFGIDLVVVIKKLDSFRIIIYKIKMRPL